MKTLSIDIETYSDMDLNKCGVYKYAESPNFEILLFAYSVDDGKVKVVDLASNETIPKEVVNALNDDGVIKYAFNANFERACLSKYFNTYFSPKSWHCTMVWSAYIGLPLSLKGVGSALKLDEQKMGEGRELIKYFCAPCVPTKVNGGRTRNLPCHDLNKWELFKKYNKRDVEVEIAIHKRLAKVPMPDFVWDEYCIDQEINDRGIMVDMNFVNSAIDMDSK